MTVCTQAKLTIRPYFLYLNFKDVTTFKDGLLKAVFVK